MVVAFYFRLHLAYFPRPVVAIFARPEHYKIFPEKDSFLIVIYGFDNPPEFWKVIAK